MRNKAALQAVQSGLDGDLHGDELRERIRRDLSRLGVPREFSDGVSARLETSVAQLAPPEYAAVLDSVAAAYAARHGLDGAEAPADDIADVQRLMQGFSEELQKLDEGLRMLSAYVSRLRERGPRSAADRVH